MLAWVAASLSNGVFVIFHLKIHALISQHSSITFGQSTNNPEQTMIMPMSAFGSVRFPKRARFGN